jgi:hypothetical protein
MTKSKNKHRWAILIGLIIAGISGYFSFIVINERLAGYLQNLSVTFLGLSVLGGLIDIIYHTVKKHTK